MPPSAKIGERLLKLLGHAWMAVALGGGDAIVIGLARSVKISGPVERLGQPTVGGALVVSLTQVEPVFRDRLPKPFEFHQFIGQTITDNTVGWIGLEHPPK